jgi:hypothetical protein
MNLMIGGIATEIRSGRLQNTTLVRRRHSNPLGEVV